MRNRYGNTPNLEANYWKYVPNSPQVGLKEELTPLPQRLKGNFNPFELSENPL